MIGFLEQFTIVITSVGWVFQITNAKCNWKVLNARFVGGTRICFIPLKQIYSHWSVLFKRAWWISLLSHWHGLQMCLELVTNKITQIPNFYKVCETHFGHSNFPSWNWEVSFPLLESSYHFENVIYKLNLNKLIFVNKHWPLDPYVGYCKHFVIACEA
jgi:hypothetical protein